MTSKRTKIISFDPGKATGIASGWFSPDEPLQLVDAIIAPYEDWVEQTWHLLYGEGLDDWTVVAERFDLRTNNDFAADLTGVRVEGGLELLHPNIQWRSRTSKAQVSDDTLRKIGWWKTGSDVEWEDGRDANDAIIHMLGHVAFTLQHRPTLEAYLQ